MYWGKVEVGINNLSEKMFQKFTKKMTQVQLNFNPISTDAPLLYPLKR